MNGDDARKARKTGQSVCGNKQNKMFCGKKYIDSCSRFNLKDGKFLL
jgi:hypothetical protein